MLLALNPSPAKVTKLCSLSKYNAAKWLKDNETGNLWFWPAGEVLHAKVAEGLKISDYEKGVAVPNEDHPA